MDPMLAASLISAGIKGGTAISQKMKARKLARTNKRPEYKRPGEISEYIESSKTRAADTKLAGQKSMEDKIGRSSANYMNNVRSAGGPNEIIQAAGVAAEGERRNLVDLNIAAAQDKRQREHDRNKSLLLGAEYADKEFQFNKVEPYDNAKAAESALRESGNKNATNAVSDLLSIGTSLAAGSKGSMNTPQPESGVATKSSGEGTETRGEKKAGEVTTDVSSAGKLPMELKNQVRRGLISLEKAIEISKLNQ